MNSLDPKLVLTTTEAADLMGISPRTLEDWRWKGIGPAFFKLGPRLVRYRLADVEAFTFQTRQLNTGGGEMS
ncbi:MAG TPA: helix-turn-helix domain-containing protein [Rhizomicrobium sp.]|nr:helix-turn-helix domain-containing protein [Rhizomicrobium sp.]